MSSTSLFQFHKLVGAGNDFIISQHPNTLTPDQIRRLCQRNFGIGADGLVLLEKSAEQSLKWYFYNNDGSKAEMCGNAARCVIRYAEMIWGWKSTRLQTVIGDVHGAVESNQETSVWWQLPSHENKQVEIELTSGRRVSGFFANTGVPHFVIDEDNSSFSLAECAEIQDHPRFQPSATNVTLIGHKDNHLTTRSFERGVRDFTLACGTGVLASALALLHNQHNLPLELHAPGGKLKVDRYQNALRLTGPALLVFSGQLTLGGSYV